MNQAELAKLVNRSGFLFQMAVEERVRETFMSHEWTVIAREYPWSSPSGRNGFVDFIAERGPLHCVFECKRTQAGEWVFLVPDSLTPTSQLRTLWAFRGQNKTCGWGWDDFPFWPKTLRSEFCIVRGASDDDKPMLERIAGDVVRASEALAQEGLQLSRRRDDVTAYLPVIVTTARLFACYVDLSEVDLLTGALPSSARFEEVSSIRFGKALPSDLSHAPASYATTHEGMLLRERSAFVVHVGHLEEWLKFLGPLNALIPSLKEPWSHLRDSTS